MRFEQYGEYLSERIEKRPKADYLSRCRRVEDGLGVDLDQEYERDGGKQLISILSYTVDDEKNHKPVPPGLGFGAGSNYRTGMASLKTACAKYFEFCRTVK